MSTDSYAFDMGYSHAVGGKAGEGPVVRNGVSPNALLTGMDQCHNLHDCFLHGVSIRPTAPCFGSRVRDDGSGGSYEWQTYQEVRARVASVAAAMWKLDLVPMAPDGRRFFGFFLKNCRDWCVTSLACFRTGIVVVPMYDTLGPETVAYIQEQTMTTSVLCSASELPQLIKVCPFTTVVVTGFVNAELLAKAKACKGFKTHLYQDFEAVGLENLSILPSLPSPKPSDLAVLCYTSGTTGNPKGAMLSHGNILSAIGNAAFKDWTLFATDGSGTQDVHISYLPLAHVFETVVMNFCLYAAAAVGFYQGDTLKLLDDLQALRPTLFASVPRLYNRFYDKIVGGAKAKGGIAAMLFTKALNTKLDVRARVESLESLSRGGGFEGCLLCSARGASPRHTEPSDAHHLATSPPRHLATSPPRHLTTSPPHHLTTRPCSSPQVLHQTGEVSHPLWDKLVFSKVQKSLGLDRCDKMICGSAPIAASVKDFLRVALGVKFIEGYGLSETAAAATICHPDDVSNFHVGMPVLCAEIKLEDVAEMGYASYKSPPSGEVCVRGPCVFMGYYKMPDKTKEAIDDDGWFHTGDIGCWTQTGCLRIVDRKKNIFKLAQGEYVAAEKIETILLRCPLVAQIFVYGDSLQSYLVGVVVPEAEEVAAWAKSAGLASTKLAEIVAGPDAPKLKAAVHKQINEGAKAAKLAGFEMIKKLHVEAELWSVDNGMLTPTFKTKRPDLQKRYQEQIDAMYAEGIETKSKL